MNTPKIQFGSNTRKEVIDDKHTLVTETKYHAGKKTATNTIVKRERIPTDQYSIDDIVNRFRELMTDPSKINPGFKRLDGVAGGGYDIIIEYTVLELE